MVEVAYMFPGQGAQYVGMGKELYSNHDIAKKTFNHANKILGFDLSKLCFDGPVEELTKTENAQVAILVVSVAALRVHMFEPSNYTPQVALGLSLGEYTALVAAEALNFSDAVKLVRLRGQYMQEAGHNMPGGMVSIMGLGVSDLEKICQISGAEIANLNCPGQVVISGNAESIAKCAELAKAKGAKRAIPLDVSGAFHSSLMAEASHKLAKALEDILILTPKIPVISNITGYSQGDPEQIKANLIDQVSSTTYWEESIKHVVERGIKMVCIL